MSWRRFKEECACFCLRDWTEHLILLYLWYVTHCFTGWWLQNTSCLKQVQLSEQSNWHCTATVLQCCQHSIDSVGVLHSVVFGSLHWCCIALCRYHKCLRQLLTSTRAAVANHGVCEVLVLNLFGHCQCAICRSKWSRNRRQWELKERVKANAMWMERSVQRFSLNSTGLL